MKKDLHKCLLAMPVLLLLQLVACTTAPKKNNPPPTSPKILLPGVGFIYGQPIEIRETTIPDHRSTPGDDITTLNWASRKASYSTPFTKRYAYWGTDLQPDSSTSEDHKDLVRYLKTPFYEYYVSYSRTKDGQEYYFQYDIDTVKRQLVELNKNPSDTSAYSLDYFSQDGSLIHRFVKVTDKESYHLFYTNDNHGNPIEERIIIMHLDFIQEKYDYEYDEQGNWLVKNLYHFNAKGEEFRMQFRRKITYRSK